MSPLASETKKNFDLFFKKNLECIFAVDQNHIILDANPATEHLFGVAIEQLIGKEFNVNLDLSKILFVTIYSKNLGFAAAEIHVADFIWERQKANLVCIRNIRNKIYRQYPQSVLLHFSDEAIFRNNKKGIILHWHVQAEKLFGYKEQEIVGKSILDLVPANGKRSVNRLQERMQKCENLKKVKCRSLCKNGKEVDVLLTAAPVLDKKDQYAGAWIAAERQILPNPPSFLNFLKIS